jgi:preprotein translocase SecE subunit
MTNEQKESVSSGNFVSGNYLTDCIAELRKVSTPSRQEAVQATWVTLIIIAFMSLCLFFMDYIFHTVVSLLVL